MMKFPKPKWTIAIHDEPLFKKGDYEPDQTYQNVAVYLKDEVDAWLKELREKLEEIKEPESLQQKLGEQGLAYLLGKGDLAREILEWLPEGG